MLIQLNLEEELAAQAMTVYLVWNDSGQVDGIVIGGSTVLNHLGDLSRACCYLLGLTYALDLKCPKTLKYMFESAEERHYNMCHSQACAIVEHTIGLFKGRWRCLDSSGGRLMYTPEKTPLHLQDVYAEDTAVAGGLRRTCCEDTGPRRMFSCSTQNHWPR
ncbi:hypothetical protein DPEC_G00071100 [Dallia pectoralis]|uniref:Uncharacterized protein n=1 Tax=Dallia pectoralis TaxID=75939 RepID=A0ACC2H1Z9_DALPE|nr:hypothetical protein DPEC_G00071100 [Dallia pectoralis]